MRRIRVNMALKKILLVDQPVDELSQLTTIEIFNLFVRKKGNLTSFEIDPELKKINFSKEYGHLKYEIILRQCFSAVRTFIDHRGIREITIDVAAATISEGYTIIDETWIPVSVESINALKIAFSGSPPEQGIPTAKAIQALTREGNDFLLSKDFNLKEVLLDNTNSLKSATPSLFEKSLYGYQLEGLNWLRNCITSGIGTILGDDMGLGKTAQIIAAICWAIEEGVVKNILIVVPATLIENWRREFLFFAPKIRPYIHHGSNRAGVASSFANQQVVITSYSLVINDFYLLNETLWDLTVLDEASLIKNPQSERTLSLKSLNSIVRIAMTGTPVENSLIDLWSISDYVLPGFLGSEADFTKKYLGKDINETLGNNLLPLKNQISQIILRRMKSDLLKDLPDKIDIHQALRMNEEEERKYIELEEKIIRTAKSNQEACLKLINELRQFTTHPAILESGTKSLTDTVFFRSKKFERTIELLEEIRAREEKVLIFTGFIDMIDIFVDYLPKRFDCKTYTIDGRVETSERQRQIDLFSNESGFSIMILNPTTAAVGLNITAANHVIHYSRQWNPAIEIQASARAYRNGQKKCVNIYYLYYADTIEQIIDDRLRAKELLSGEVIQPASHSGDEGLEILAELVEMRKNKKEGI